MTVVKSALEHSRQEFQELRIKQQAYFHALENLEVGMREMGLLDPTENLQSGERFTALTWKEFLDGVESRKLIDVPMPWCEPCGSYHAVSKSVEHHKALQCRKIWKGEAVS